MRSFVRHLVILLAVSLLPTTLPVRDAFGDEAVTENGDGQGAVDAGDNDQANDGDNEYIKRLIVEEARSEAQLKSFVQEKMPKDLLDMQRDAIRQVSIQIELARDRLAAGQPFGKKEYEAATATIRKELAASLARMKKRSEEAYQNALKKADREHKLAIEQATRKWSQDRDLTQENYRRGVDAVALKRQFLANPGRIGLVIWNMPIDQRLHKRLAIAVNIRLLQGDDVVWSQKNYRLDRRRADNLIRLPNVMFDKVVVDVTRWSGVGGGLAEVEAYAGEVNVARNRPCVVTNTETLPIHLDDQHALTDGNCRPAKLGEGYWIPEERTKASVTIDLLGPPVMAQEPPAAEPRR